MGSESRNHFLQFTILIIFLSRFSVANAGIKCFECSSVNDNYCPDTMSNDDEDIVEIKDCENALYEAMYCVKTTGVTGGCSSSDLYCFVCDQTATTGNEEDFACSDSQFLGPMKSCKDIFDAQFCVKTEGVWGGSLGTRRFCSSRDLGNYCDFIKRPGDQLEYRSCVYTCTDDGCNGALSFRTNGPILILTLSVLISTLLPAISSLFFLTI